MASALVGAVVGAILVLAVEGATRDLTPEVPTTRSAAPTPTFDVSRQAAPVRPRRTILLAWAPGGLPAGAERAAESMPQVESATTVVAGLDWIRSVRDADGAVVERVPRGYGIPFEVAVIDPEGYAPHVPPSERTAIVELTPGQGVLASTAAELRGVGEGSTIRMDGRKVNIVGVVSDVATQGYEALLAPPVPRNWERKDRFLLMKVSRESERRAVARRVEGTLAPEQVLRIRAQGETPFLRYGDAVLPQLHIKATFGEFAARPNRDGSIDIERGWRQKHITSEPVPILGTVTCHRALFPQLRHALEQVERAGFSHVIDAGDYGGCYSARFIDRNPGGRLSHHSWGIGIDLNVAENRPGTRPDQDHRLVRIFEENGFTWGGRWLIPDGMHFEWVKFPD